MARPSSHKAQKPGSGTTVTGPGGVGKSRLVIDAGLEVLESLEQMAKRSGLHLEMGEMAVCERVVSAEEAGPMGVTPAEPATCVTRVIMVEGKPVAHLTDLLPQTILRQAELGPDFRGSVLDHLVARSWPALSHSRTELVSEAADRNLAQALRVARGAPLMKLEARLFATDGRVIDYSISYFVPGSFRFHVVRRVAGA